MTSVGPKLPKFSQLATRKATFDVFWPQQLPISSAELIIQGFFYTRIADRVICFNCEGGLYNLDKDDDIFIIHYRNFPNCENIIRNTTKKFRTDRMQKNIDKTYTNRIFVPDEEDLILTCKANMARTFKQKLQFFKSNALANLHISQKYNQILKTQNINLLHEKDQLLLQNTRLRTRLEQLETPLQCSICIDREINVTTQCGHLFCNICLANSTNCPRCRTPITTRQIVYI